MASIDKMKNEVKAMHDEADRLYAATIEVSQIPYSEYVLVKTDDFLRVAYVGRFNDIVRAGGMWRIKLNELGIVVLSNKRYEIGNGDEFLSERNELFLISVDMRETTRSIQGRGTLARETIEERRQEYLNSYYPNVYCPLVVGMDGISQALKDYGLTWTDYRKAISSE